MPAVRLGGEVVLVASWPGSSWDTQAKLCSAAVEGGPIFDGLAPRTRTNRTEIAEAPAAQPAEPARLRRWNVGGTSIEAEYVRTIGDRVVLGSAAGRQLRVAPGALGAEDRDYVALANPPTFNLSFVKKSDQRIIKTTPHLSELPPRILDYTFGAKERQTSARPYGRPVHFELFAMGQQRLDDDKYILLDHQTSSFTPGAANNRSHAFSGRKVELMSYDTSQPMGRKYSDYLLIVRDARGRIIQHAASANWLFPNRGKLAELKVGDFLNDQGERVYPTGPGPRSLYH